MQVKLGDAVTRGETIGEISQNELTDTIHESELKLKDAEHQDLEFTRHEQEERDTQLASIERVRRAIKESQATARVKLKIAESIAIGDDRLRARKYIGDVELLESREKLYQIKDDLNKGTSWLAELDLEWTKGENLRRQRAARRKVKLQQLKTHLDVDRAKLLRTSQVVSQVNGRVVQVLSAIGELVPEGSPVVLLDCPKSEHIGDGDAENYESIVFVPAGEGKKIDLGDRVEVTPATIKREEHGFIWGRVVVSGKCRPPSERWKPARTSRARRGVRQAVCANGLLRVHVKLDEPAFPEAAAAAASGARGGVRSQSGQPISLVIALRRRTTAQNRHDVPGRDRGRPASADSVDLALAQKGGRIGMIAS